MGADTFWGVFLGADGEDAYMKVKSQSSKVKTKTKNLKLFNFTLWLLVFTFSLSFFGVSCAQREGLSVGDKAPDFTLEDLSGKNVKLSDEIGANSATLLVFWTTWCPYCREEIPELIRLNMDYKDKGLKILAIDIGESPKKVESVAKQEGIGYTVLLDSDNRVASQYGVMGIPANILLDKEGVIKYRGTAPPPQDLLPKK